MSGDASIVLAVVSGGAVVAVMEPAAIPLLRRAAVIDVPGRRSSHAVPTPRGGGAPIACGLLVAAVIIHTFAALTLAVAVAAYGVIGLADDLRGLPAGRRLVLQGLAGAAVASLLVSRLRMPPLALAACGAAAVVWLAGFVNAFNFMDGVNGISGVHALIGGLTYACLGAWLPDKFLVAAGATVAVGALAFLPWNAIRARVFLGDVGSYGLGAALALLAGYAVLHGIPLEAVIAPLALYLTDTSWTLLRRIRAGEPWLEAHRSHIYQRWCDVGWSHQRVAAVSAAGTALLVMLGSASLTGDLALRILADLAGIGVLAIYVGSPSLLAQPEPQSETN
ncbi:MAG: MraY family glycosyltransferase [Streptosporangiaceae bacterium]